MGTPRSRPLGLAAALLSLACSPYELRHEIQWDAHRQIWQADASQVRVRAAQSRVLDTHDRLRTLEAVVATFQDLGFQVELLDPQLGIVSGKKFVDLERPPGVRDPYYFLYDEGSLLVLSRVYRSWGPFWHRSDLVRLTVTVRERNESQLIVRASAQFALRPIEDPEPYQQLFRTLEQALFVDREVSPAGGADTGGAETWRPAPVLDASGQLVQGRHLARSKEMPEGIQP